MKRREFMQVVSTGLLSAMVMPGGMGRLLIQPVGRVPAAFNFGIEGCCKIMAVGIGKTAASSVAIVSSDAPYVSCHQIIFDPAGKGTHLRDLLVQVRATDLLFLLSAFDDATCIPLFEGLGAAAKESGVLTVGIVPATGALRPDSKTVSCLYPVSRLALPPSPLHAQNQGTDLSGWDWYAMRQLAVTVADIIHRHSLICVDFADVKSVLTSGAQGSMGVGVAPIGSAHLAAIGALDRLQGQGFSIGEGSGFLACVRGSSAMSVDDFDDAVRAFYDAVPEESNFISSIVMDESMGGNIKFTVLANAAGNVPGVNLI